MYAKDHHIERYASEVDELRQDPDETEAMYSRRLLQKANECAGVCTDQDLIRRFIRGLRPDLKPLVSMSTFDPERKKTLMDYVDFATAQGEAHREIRRSSSNPKKTGSVPKRKTTGRTGSSRTLLVDRPTDRRHYSSSDSEESTDSDIERRAEVALIVYDILPTPPSLEPTLSGSSTPTVESVSTAADVLAILPNRNPRLPAYAQPTREQRPGWVVAEDRPNDICFGCFGVGHKKPNCPHASRVDHEPAYDAFRRGNYFALSFEQKKWLALVGRLPPFALQPDAVAAQASGANPAPTQRVRFRHPVDLPPLPASPTNKGTPRPPPPSLPQTPAVLQEKLQAKKA